MDKVPLSMQSLFIHAATWHGNLDEAELMLKQNPELSTASIHSAAVCGNTDAVRKFISKDPFSATKIAEPFGGNALVYLGLSKYLRLDPSKENDFVETATVLLDAGADANSGFWTTGQFPEFESAMYGAAGVAHNEALTRLLLSRGADPNDGEVVYHSPESFDLGALKAVVETGKLTPESLALMLVRKHDWHDYHGVKYLLDHGANPNGTKDKGWWPLRQALIRDNHFAIIKLLFDYGVDPRLEKDGQTGISRAAREGRGDVLTLIAEKGFSIGLKGVDRLIAAAAMGDREQVNFILAGAPALRDQLLAMGGVLIAKFSGTGNSAGVELLLEIGIPSHIPFSEGDPYYGIPKQSLPIHIAAWRLRPDVLKVLIRHGSPVDDRDPDGNTPLKLVIRASVDSYWNDRRSIEPVKILLEAGADPKNIIIPSGYPEADELLVAAGN